MTKDVAHILAGAIETAGEAIESGLVYVAAAIIIGACMRALLNR